MKSFKKIFTILIFFILMVNGFSESTSPFRLSFLTDGIILGGGLATNITSIIVEKNITHPTPTDLHLSNVPKIDSWCAQPYSKNLDITSDVFQYVATFSPAVLMSQPLSEWITIGVMYAEAIVWAYGLKNLGKFAVSRARPFMYFDNIPESYVKENDCYNSWPSGHTVSAFNGAMFASYVFSQYAPDSPWKIPVIATSFGIATTTAILRCLSGNHFFTDVLTGAVIGSATGFLVPFFHSRPFWQTKQTANKKGVKEVELMPTGNGIYCRMAF